MPKYRLEYEIAPMRGILSFENDNLHIVLNMLVAKACKHKLNYWSVREYLEKGGYLSLAIKDPNFIEV